MSRVKRIQILWPVYKEMMMMEKEGHHWWIKKTRRTWARNPMGTWVNQLRQWSGQSWQRSSQSSKQDQGREQNHLPPVGCCVVKVSNAVSFARLMPMGWWDNQFPLYLSHLKDKGPCQKWQKIEGKHVCINQNNKGLSREASTVEAREC